MARHMRRSGGGEMFIAIVLLVWWHKALTWVVYGMLVVLALAVGYKLMAFTKSSPQSPTSSCRYVAD